MKKHFILILGLLLALVLAACGTTTGPQGEIPTAESKVGFVDDDTFWIVTVDTEWDQMRSQVNSAVQSFRKANPDLEVKVEYLHSDNVKELEIRLAQLRVDIMAGKGPDVFILPTERGSGTGTTGFNTYPKSGSAEATLFTDVMQTIQNGHFLDISEEYDADAELGKDGLISAVMDAGVYDGKRYVLPLRYDLPVYVVDTERLAETGKDLEWLANTNVISMMEDAIAANDPILAGCSYPGLLRRGRMLSYYYDRFDYQTDNIELTTEELASLLEKAETINEICGDSEYLKGTELVNYLITGKYLGSVRYPVQQMLLQEAVDVALACKTEGVAYTMLPCRMADGSVVAHVTWYGAVGSGCNDPALGYEFIRMFLTEEYQWELNRPQSTGTTSIESLGMIAEGFPVRNHGAAEHVGKNGLRDVSSYIGSGKPDARSRLGKFFHISLTDEDLPFLDFEINAVRFPLPAERNYWRNICASVDEQGNPYYDSTTAMAEEILKQLRYQLAEG